MAKKQENKNLKIFSKTVLTTASFLLLFLFSGGATPAQSYDCSFLTGEEKETCEARVKKAEAYKDLIEIKTKTQATLQNQLAVIDAQQEKTQTELIKTKNKAEELAQQISNLEKDIINEQKQIDYQRSLLIGLMQSYYEDYQQGLLHIVLANEDFSNILSQADHIDNSSVKVSDILIAVKESKARLDKQKDELAGKKQESDKAKEELEKKNLNLQYSETQKQTLLGQTQAEKAKYEELLSHIEDEIYSLEATKSVDYNNIPAAKGGYFDYPVSSPSTTQTYGCLQDAFARRSYPACNGGKGGFHNGFDFGKNSGTRIFAVKDGKIIGSGDNGKYAYGRWLAIDHGDGLVTLYGHFNSKSVNKGASVKAGQQIGVMGTTGYSTGVHLHFSVFDKKSFEVVESSKVNGLMLPTGASITPKRYL